MPQNRTPNSRYISLNTETGSGRRKSCDIPFESSRSADAHRAQKVLNRITQSVMVASRSIMPRSQNRRSKSNLALRKPKNNPIASKL